MRPIEKIHLFFKGPTRGGGASLQDCLAGSKGRNTYNVRQPLKVKDIQHSMLEYSWISLPTYVLR